MAFLPKPGEKIEFSSEDEDDSLLDRLKNCLSNNRQSSYEGSIDENYDYELSEDEDHRLRVFWSGETHLNRGV